MSARLLAMTLLAIAAQPQFKSGVDLIAVDVSVTRGGAPVLGLTADNFVVTDNRVPQHIRTVRLDRLPLTVLLVLDVSGSVAGERLTHLTSAASQLQRSLSPDDKILLVTFSHRIDLVLPPTQSAASLADALGHVKAWGQTSLYDAVHTAIQLRPDSTRPLVLVFTDGEDNTSWLDARDIVDEARASELVIHAIELKDEKGSEVPGFANARSASASVSTAVLGRIASSAGGRVWSAKSPRDLNTLFTQALEEMRSRYLLTYTLTGVPQEGWHALKVTLKDARGEVTARPGYFVPARNPV